MRHPNALIASCLLTLCACTPYTGVVNQQSQGTGSQPQTLAQQRHLTRSDCFWRFHERTDEATDPSGEMIFAMSASKHVARIQLDGTLYRLQIKSSVVSSPLEYGAEGLTVKLIADALDPQGRMEAVLALTTADGLSKIMPVVGKEECP